MKHDWIFGEVYVNEIGRDVMMKAKTSSFPIGTIILREKIPAIIDLYEVKNESKEVKDNRKPELLAVMVKREKGFNPENNDWEFLVLEGDASKIRQREKTGSCQACHAQQKENDFVFRTYLPEDVRSK